MDFLTFLKDSVTTLSWHDPKVFAALLGLVLLMFFRRFLLVGMSLAVLVSAKVVEYYFPQATGGIVGDMTLVQVIYIVGAIIVVITALGQMVLRH